MSTRPLVGIAIPGTPDDHGLARELAANYAGAFERLGYATEILPIHHNRPDMMHQLLRPEVRLVFSHGAWIASPDGPLGGGTRDALARADKPIIALIVDPPFAPWLPGILVNLPRRAGVFHIDPGFAIGIENWVASGVQEAFLPCGLHGAPEPPPDAETRTIPALYVGRVLDPDAIHRSVAETPGITPLFRALVDTGLPDHATPLIRHALTLAQGLGFPADMDNAAFRSALNLADQFIRGARRLALLRQLLRHRVHIVTDRLPRVPWMHPGAVVSPTVPYNQMQAMLRQARVSVICQPYFPGALNERIVYSMQAGCAVISTTNPRLEQLFRDGEDMWLLAPDLSDLEAKLDAAATARPEMAARAQAMVRARHTPDGNLRYMLATMRARGLLDDDLPIPEGPMTHVPPPPEWRLAPRVA